MNRNDQVDKYHYVFGTRPGYTWIQTTFKANMSTINNLFIYPDLCPSSLLKPVAYMPESFGRPRNE